MTDWNPNDTATLGLEWQPITQGVVTLDALNKMTAVSLDQSASVGINNVRIPNVGLPIRGGIFAVEVYDNETAVPVDAPTSLIAVPNEDVVDGAWLNQSGNNTNMFQSIDEGSSVNTTDYIRVSATGSTYWSRFNTATLSLTGKRIVRVRLHVNCVIGPTGRMTRGIQLSGLNYSGGAGEVAGPQARQTYTTTFTYNPSTKKPWTIADVQALDSTDSWWVYGATTAGVWSVVEVYSVWLEVTVVTENRLAVGNLDDSASGLTAGTVSSPAWNTAAVLTPTGAAWTKDGSGKHLYTVRRLNSTGAMSIPYLEGPNAPNAGRGWTPTVDATYGYATAMGSAQARMFPFVQQAASVDHVDSQPYTVLKTASVRSGQNAESEFSGAAALPYGILQFMANNASGATADLDIKVKRRSDNVQLGTTITLTRAAYAALVDYGGGWKSIRLQLGTAGTLAAATQYYIEFSSSTVSGAPWTIAVPSANGAGQTATYNGTTDAATFNGVADDTSSDIAVTLSTVPTAPSTFTATLGSQAVSETVNCVVAVARADLAWTATALGGSFLRYEIERTEDAGATWVPIAYVGVESVVAWKDYEAPRGIAVSYRIRVVRQDGAFSAWQTAAGSVTKPLMAGTGAYAATMFFVSNYNPTQNLAYEYRPGKEYDFPEADEQQRAGAYFRDYQVAANPIENRGVVAHWTLLVGADDKVPVGGGKSWAAFDPLRALARAVIPYVCALDARGQRLYCQLQVPNGSEDSRGGADLYLAEVNGAQVTATPFVVAVIA